MTDREECGDPGDGALWMQSADYRLGVRGFLLRFDPSAGEPGVYAFDAYPRVERFLDGVIPIAGSFDGFLQRYLPEPAALTRRR
jgi:hypothetical protein